MGKCVIRLVGNHGLREPPVGGPRRIFFPLLASVTLIILGHEWEVGARCTLPFAILTA